MYANCCERTCRESTRKARPLQSWPGPRCSGNMLGNVASWQGKHLRQTLQGLSAHNHLHHFLRKRSQSKFHRQFRLQPSIYQLMGRYAHLQDCNSISGINLSGYCTIHLLIGDSHVLNSTRPGLSKNSPSKRPSFLGPPIRTFLNCEKWGELLHDSHSAHHAYDRALQSFRSKATGSPNVTSHAVFDFRLHPFGFSCTCRVHRPKYRQQLTNELAGRCGII